MHDFACIVDVFLRVVSIIFHMVHPYIAVQ